MLLAFPSLGLLLALMALSTSVFARMVDDTMSVAMYMSVRRHAPLVAQRRVAVCQVVCALTRPGMRRACCVADAS